MADRFAPHGTIWVCQACGKTHSDLYGIIGKGDRGWDESCALNAMLCDENRTFDKKGVYRRATRPINAEDRT